LDFKREIRYGIKLLKCQELGNLVFLFLSQYFIVPKPGSEKYSFPHEEKKNDKRFTPGPGISIILKY
jgi:hypothetical protein